MFSCEAVYNNLRQTLAKYAARFDSVEIQIFAIEMELERTLTGEISSYDPALLHEFKKLCSDEITRNAAYSVAADYVEKELIELRRVKHAEQIVADLRSAGKGEDPKDELKGW